MRLLGLEEADRDPARDADDARHDRHRRGELLAVADPVVEEGQQVGAAAAGRLDLRLVVAEAAVLAEPLLQQLRLLEAGRGVGGHAGRQPADLVVEAGRDVGEDARHACRRRTTALFIALGVVGQLDAGEVVGQLGRGDVVAGGDEVAGVDVVAPVGAGGDLRDLRRGGQPGRLEVGTDADVVLELACAARSAATPSSGGQRAGGGLGVGDLAVARRPRVPLKRVRTESRR